MTKMDMQRASKEVHTAGEPYQIKLESDRLKLNSDGKDLAFVTVSVVDKQGNFCPTATNELKFQVKGQGSFKAVCNGDPTSLELFHLPKMKLFSGKLVVLVQSKTANGDMTLEVRGKQLKTASLVLESGKGI